MIAPSRSLAACPGVYAGEPSDAGGSNEICTPGTLSVSCDLGANGDASDTVSWFVMDTDSHFQAYGVAGNGNRFCFETDIDDTCGAGNQNTFTIRGTESDDQINNVNLLNGYALKCANVVVYGEYGSDSLYGSNDTTALETLYGEGGSDSIWGREGDDTLDGGEYPDLMWGGPGVDTMRGGADDDRLKGGDGADKLFGQGGDDDLCGEGDSDEFYGDTGLDVLYGGGTDDAVQDGGADDDWCENDATNTSCLYLTIVACPW